MKLQYLFLLIASALISSCAHYDTHFYRIVTTNSHSFDYSVLETTDSGVRVIPWEYHDEMTPEVIREFSREIPYDSMKSFKKESTTSSDINYTLLGFSAGSLIAPTLAGAATSVSGGYSERSSTVAAGITVFAPIACGVAAYLINSHEDDMLPPRKKNVKYRNE